MSFSMSAVADLLRSIAGKPKKNYSTCAIILAGGSGTRMGDVGTTKQLLDIDGIPVVVRSILAYENCPIISEIIVAAKKDEIPLYEEFRRKYRISKFKAVVPGGDTRQASVFSALKAVSEKSEFVAIHDGARCCITPEMIEMTARSAYSCGAAAAAARVSDTVKVADKNGYIVNTIDRDTVWLVSTPQIIRTDVYRACAYSAREKGIIATDDCGLLEAHGFKIKLCDVGKDNIKITQKEDVAAAKAILAKRAEDGKCE
ncbi:MAG: 2-C-methyl-D-erythritol 4-phosphate cytidylyltransferase [Clostridia bacterium]|nr:2-C-methyl-D-erythritol 4-phosphate cytidylyltransferase [Clostridia bacterium]